MRGTPRRSVNQGEAARLVTFAPDGGSQQLTADLPAGTGLLPLDGTLTRLVTLQLSVAVTRKVTLLRPH